MKIILMIVFLALLFFFLLKYHLKSGGKNHAENNSDDYTEKNSIDVNSIEVVKSNLLTLNELNFYRVLKQMIPEYYNISCKCRLEDIMKVPEHAAFRNAKRNKIKSRHIDFVIFNESSADIEFAVELDDATHKFPQQRKSDHEKDILCQNAGIKLIRIRARTNYDADEIRTDIEKMLNQNMQI